MLFWQNSECNGTFGTTLVHSSGTSDFVHIPSICSTIFRQFFMFVLIIIMNKYGKFNDLNIRYQGLVHVSLSDQL